MISKHLSDTDIQEYILGNLDHQMVVIEHLKVCNRCKAKTEMYQQLFFAIKVQPKPQFNFDLTRMVLSKITQSNPKFSLSTLLVYLFAGAGVICISFVFYLFSEYVADLFSGFSAIILSFMLVTTLAILILQSVDLIRKYQRKMDELNFY